MAYIIKIDVQVYEDNDDVTDVMGVTVRARTTNKATAIGYAKAVADEAQAKIRELQRK